MVPSDVWLMELEIFSRDKGYRRDLGTEIILPFKYLGRWMASVWDCSTHRRDVLLFAEIDLSEE